MKIAIDVSQAIYGTGVSIYTKNLVHYLLKILPKEHMLVLFGGSLRRKQELDKWINRLPQTINKTYFLPPEFVNILWNNLHLLKIESLIGDADIVHTSDWSEPPSKLPKVTTVHDLNFFRDPSFSHAGVRSAHTKRLFWVAKESLKIIAVSQATKNDLIKYLDLDPNRIEVIYEGPSIMNAPLVGASQIVKSKYGLNRPYFFVPGAGHPRKNISRIVQALHQTKLGYQLLIAGRPSADETKHGSKDVIFTGFVPESDWGPLISGAQALLYPSLYEGFGVPILDSFVCGTPVVTSNVSSLPEIAGKSAVLVEPTDVNSIATGILRALEDKSALIEAGNRRLELFSWDKTAKETLRLYELVLKNVNSH